MRKSMRITLFAVLAVVLVAGATAYAVSERGDYVRQTETPPSVPTVEPGSPLVDGPRIVFRHTGLDSHYGTVAMVSLDDPSGPRAFTDVPCDRVDADAEGASCLFSKRGVVTDYSDVLYDADWKKTESLPLAGIPSRTRLSPDGSLVASTVFVTGHSYMQVGFSTVTSIRAVDGSLGYANLERFSLSIAGQSVAPVDRNIWGVTFADDDRTFFATVGTGGKTYLVQGDLEAKTLTAIAENAECPSLSPDGTHVAFKVDRDPGDSKLWGLAVLDLASGKRVELTDGPAGLDDQVEWLDDDTLLYGMPRDGETGVTDVWSVDTYPDAKPSLLIEDAWSPAVISTSASSGGER